MAILCFGDCHVWLGSSSLCTCEAHRVAMLFPGQGWNVVGGNAPQPTPPTAPDVPLSRLKAAEAVHATHLSADGLTAYDERQLGVWYCGWDEERKEFGSWYKILCGILPNDAVRM